MYKLTDRDMRTYGGFQWELRRWHVISRRERGGGLCSESYFHCYDNALLAVLLNPDHANFANPRLFKCDVKGGSAEDCGLKFGFTKMRLTKEMLLPEVTTTQRIAFGILCAKEVCDDACWNEWADKWLDGTDRSSEAVITNTKDERVHARWATTHAAWAARADTVVRCRQDGAMAATHAAFIETIDLRCLALKAMEY